MQETPIISATQKLPELTFKVIFLSILLAIILAASNTYLGLKMGRTISGSIPGAVISIAVLHWFRRKNILEHNIVQTAASGGECLASGVVFTIPALLILGIWSEFNFLDTLIISLIGGSLGVLFSVPLRRTMIIEKKLPYPEGIAVAEILKVSEDKETGAKYLLRGGVFASLVTFLQVGLKVIGDGFTIWTSKFGVLNGFGFGFSPVLLAAGYIVGLGVVSTIFLGNIITWYIAIPIMSALDPITLLEEPSLAANNLFKDHFRYASIGAIVFGGVWSLITLLKPMIEAVRTSFASLRNKQTASIVRTEYDIPMPYVVGFVLLFAIPIFALFHHNIIYYGFPITTELLIIIVTICTFFAIILGFVSSSIASYLVGLVGTSSLPISGIAISSISFIAVILMGLFGLQMSFDNPQYATHAAGITIIFAAIMCLCASLGGDNMQDLRAGYALGATPWKQQFILFVSVVAGSLVMAPVLNLLLNAYGIGDVLPREGMDPSKALIAPQATIMAAISENVFLGQLNTTMFSIGIVIAAIVAFIDRYLEKTKAKFRTPVLAFGLGMYLPMSMVTALFLGGLFSYLILRNTKASDRPTAERRGILVAAGIIAGEALTGILLAIPFSLSAEGENALALNLNLSPDILVILGLVGFLGLMYLLYTSRK